MLIEIASITQSIRRKIFEFRIYISAFDFSHYRKLQKSFVYKNTICSSSVKSLSDFHFKEKIHTKNHVTLVNDVHVNRKCTWVCNKENPCSICPYSCNVIFFQAMSRTTFFYPVNIHITYVFCSLISIPINTECLWSTRKLSP